MRVISSAARIVAAVSNWFIGWLLLATVVVNVAQVFTRYVMNDPLFWTEEVIRYITVWFTFFGAAAVSHADEHMDMNMFAGVGSAVVQALHKVLLQVLVIAFAGVTLWEGTRYVLLNGMQTSPTTGIAMIWIYSAMPIGAAMMIVVALFKIAEQVAVLGGRARRIP